MILAKNSYLSEEKQGTMKKICLGILLLPISLMIGCKDDVFTPDKELKGHKWESLVEKYGSAPVDMGITVSYSTIDKAMEIFPEAQCVRTMEKGDRVTKSYSLVTTIESSLAFSGHTAEYSRDVTDLHELREYEPVTIRYETSPGTFTKSDDVKEYRLELTESSFFYQETDLKTGFKGRCTIALKDGKLEVKFSDVVSSTEETTTTTENISYSYSLRGCDLVLHDGSREIKGVFSKDFAFLCLVREEAEDNEYLICNEKYVPGVSQPPLFE